MDYIYDLETAITNKIESEMTETSAESVGLDPRAGHLLYISSEDIAVPSHADGSLQYYGGFEYVDSDYRKAFGDWVIYSSEDDRVRSAIEAYGKVEG